MARVGEVELEALLDSDNENVSEVSDASDNVETDSESESEVPPLEPSNAGYFLSWDGSVKWYKAKQPRVRSKPNISKRPGPSAYAIVRAKDVKSTFLLFFPPAVKTKILQMSNMEGLSVFGQHWENITDGDFLCYIGVLILAGVYRSHDEETTNLWDDKFGRPIFRAAMSLNRFKMITRALRFDNKTTRLERRSKDKLAPVREIWDEWVSILSKAYNPGENLVIDEQLIPFRGRCPFRRYVPSKPAKYGLKIWVACDCRNSYAWSMRIHVGNSGKGNQGKKIVLELSRGLRGQNITCGSFFTTYDLGQELLRENLTMLGCVKKNKPEIPPDLLRCRKNTSLFAFAKDTMIVSYVPQNNKPMLLMSTLHDEPEITDSKDKKPQMVIDYNETKIGVDILDQSISSYTCRVKTKRWPMAVFTHMVDVSAYNAFVIWQDINPTYYERKLYKRRSFLHELGYELVKPKLQLTTQQPRSKALTEVGPVTKKRRRCYKCPGSDLKYNTYCRNCNKCICKTHLVSLCSDCV